ncbi:MAG: ABC transporter substrate-binding protein [Candidatus Heimdallarchaeota archaeon]
MSRVKRKVRTIILIGLLCGFFPTLNTGLVFANDSNPEPVFYISILTSNPGGPPPSAFVLTLAEDLPKIGIGVDLCIENWNFIINRTWGYPGPYPIPTYAEGGYDIFSIGWRWGLDWNPYDLYAEPTICGGGMNFYQYITDEINWALENYTRTIDYADRIFWGNKIQQIIYEDVPLLPVSQSDEFILHDSNLTGLDGKLFRYAYQSMENWSIPTQTELHASVGYFRDFFVFNAYQFTDLLWLNQIYNSLIKRDPKIGYFYAPDIATSFTTTDGLTYTVSINPNAVWADGTPLNTSDVAFSFELVAAISKNLNKDLSSKNIAYDYSINIIDEHTLEISFDNRYHFLPESNLDVYLIPKHIWKDVPINNLSQQALEWAKTDPTKLIGTGPFYLYEYNESPRVIHLKRNPFYANWSGITPNFEDIYFEYLPTLSTAKELAALKNGELDLIIDSVSVGGTNLSALPATIGYTMIDSDSVHEFAINNMHPILGTGEVCPIAGPQSAKYVRKAINHAVNRELICKELPGQFNDPAATPCPKSSPVYNSSLKPAEYDLELAKEYLRKAGYDIPLTIISFGIGVSFPVFVSLLALIGGCVTVFRRKDR